MKKPKTCLSILSRRLQQGDLVRNNPRSMVRMRGSTISRKPAFNGPYESRPGDQTQLNSQSSSKKLHGEGRRHGRQMNYQKTTSDRGSRSTGLHIMLQTSHYSSSQAGGLRTNMQQQSATEACLRSRRKPNHTSERNPMGGGCQTMPHRGTPRHI